ncbi:hypothetical protein [Vibrio splendidus]|uniref:hypothetical protein n=1 Tax=Vibrio splendidus TaxID=29497 RepID=UPI003CE45DDD
MTKPHYNEINWMQYNQALINHESLIFWIGEEAIQHLAVDATGLKVYGKVSEK